MLKIWIVVVAVILLSGCASEVDKCVEAEMKAWKVQNKNNIRENKEVERINAEVKLHNDEARKYNESLPKCEARSDLTAIESLIICGERLREIKSFRSKKDVDERASEVVEAEFRRNCLRLSSK